jgi:hypothetical protein
MECAIPFTELASVRAEPTGSGEGQGLLWDNVRKLTPVIRNVLKTNPATHVRGAFLISKIY